MYYKFPGKRCYYYVFISGKTILSLKHFITFTTVLKQTLPIVSLSLVLTDSKTRTIWNHSHLGDWFLVLMSFPLFRQSHLLLKSKRVQRKFDRRSFGPSLRVARQPCSNTLRPHSNTKFMSISLVVVCKLSNCCTRKVTYRTRFVIRFVKCLKINQKSFFFILQF